MGISFAAASRVSIVDAPNAVTRMAAAAFPLSVGCWFRVDVALTEQVTVWRSGGGSGFLELTIGSGGFAGSPGFASSTNTATVTSAPDVGAWAFALCRSITAGSRRISVLSHNERGTSEHAANAISVTPTGMDTLSIGGVSGSSVDFTGSVAEFWACDIDVQAEDSQTDEALLRQLAYRGPFSVPHVARRINHYISFRSHILDRGPGQRQSGDVYFSNEPWAQWPQGTQITVTGTVTTTGHPPLSPSYRRPRAMRPIRGV